MVYALPTDQDGGTARSNSCDESFVTDGRKKDGTGCILLKAEEYSPFNNIEENLPVNTPTNEKKLLLSDTQKVEGVCIVSPYQDLCQVKENERDIGCETFSALFDDDADEYMLRCSQEIEENLNKNVTVVCSDNSELPLPQYKSSDFVSVESKMTGPNICKPERNSSVHVKPNCSSKKPNIPKVGTKYYVRIKSGTPKHHKSERGHSRSSHDRSGAAMRVCHARTNTQSAVISPKAPSTNEIAFDDSFDAVIQNLSEEDIEMLSQGQVVDRKVTGKGTGKPCFQKVEDKTQSNCNRGNTQKFAARQSPSAHRVTSNNRPINQINSDRQRNRVNQGPALHQVCAPRINKMQFQLKVPSEMCNSRRLSDWPFTVSPVQLNDSHFNKNVPLVNDQVFVSQQRLSNSAPVKNSDSVQPSSSTISNSLARKYYVRIRPRRLEYITCENCASGFSVNCLSASVRTCHGGPYLCSKHTEEQSHSKRAVKAPSSILDTL